MESYLRAAVLGLLLLTCSAVAGAFDELEVGDLSYLDKQYMNAQRASLNELVGTHYGSRLKGDRDNDLRLLQRLLDDRVVRADQRRELQAMGIVMGDLLSQQLGMHWVVYEDKLGRSRALRFQETDTYLFPVTMISRRWEGGAYIPVAEIYQKAVDTITPALPTLPFQ